MTSQLLELRIEALERRIKALEDALISQSIIEAVTDPDLITVKSTAAPAEAITDPNRTEAAAQYNKQPEEYKMIAEHVQDREIKECIDRTKTGLPFIYLEDAYRHYIQLCISKNSTPIFQKYFLIAANRAGYPTYFYYGRTCIWISDKPKKKPGKRKKQK